MSEQLVTPRLLSTKSAANYTGVSIRTIGLWIAERLVATRKVGGRRLIEKESLDAFIDSAERTAANGEREAVSSLAEQIAREVVRLMREE